MAPNRRPKSAPRMTARSVNSLRVSPSGTNGRNSPGGAVELHGRSLKESLPGPNQIGCVRDYAAGGASGEANLGAAGPWRNTDTFEIALPAGYEVDDLPPAVNADYSFASYHSKAEVTSK